MNDLLERVRQGDRRAVARAITQIEGSRDRARDIIMKLYPDTGRAHVVGVTGAPGTGKSTLVNEMARELRRRNLLVGIIAVDPSSPFSGGALLGDRIRMQDIAGDPGIFIRSMASRGNLGGLASATSSVVKVLDAAGFDIILVETVGAGQAEVSIANTAHTTVVIDAPGMGDDIQSIKAGILEIADILVVNKADRQGAANTVKALRMMLHMGHGNQRSRSGPSLATPASNGPANKNSQDEAVWVVQVFETVAPDAKGVAEVVNTILAHGDYLKQSGQWLEREKDRSRQEIEQIMQGHLDLRLERDVSKDERDHLVTAVADREIDPYTAADRLFTQIFPDR